MVEKNETSQAAGELTRGKVVTIVALGFAFSIGWWLCRDYLTLANLAHQESLLRIHYRDHPAFVLTAAFVLYVAVAGISIPAGATVLSLAYAWFFKFWTALVLISFASTTGATLAFLMSRYLLRNWVQHRFANRVANIGNAVEQNGLSFLISVRLVPVIPFFLVNLVMGLTRIRTFSYWWVSQLAMLPGTAVYVYAGAAIPDLTTLQNEGVNAVFDPWQLTQITIAMALLGALPILVKRVLRVGSTSVSN